LREKGPVVGSWNPMTYDGKDTLLRVLRQEAERLFALADRPDAWEAPTGGRGWEVRDIVGHLVETTEAYFAAFDAARNHTEVDPAYGLRGMAARLTDQTPALRSVPREELMARLRGDFARALQLFESLGPDEWEGFTVRHYYLGPLPAYFYPAFQLMDYTVHSWDIRQGSGRAHGVSGEAADLLVPFMFVLWQATTAPRPDEEACEIGILVASGANASSTRVRVDPEGLWYEAGDLADLPAMIEFDPGSFVLTAFGRSNSGAIRGDHEIADRYLNLFFRI
jgi:uncharacterized protein (TIGR03083 family)